MLSAFAETVERLQIILIVAAVVQTIWIIWFTTAIAGMRRSLRDIRNNSNATAFDIERVGRDDFAALNSGATLRECGQCLTSAIHGRIPKCVVAYVRRHGEPTYLCLHCAEKNHRSLWKPWDSEKENAAVAELCVEAGFDKK